MKVIVCENYRKDLAHLLNKIVFCTAKVESFGTDDFGSKTYLLTDINSNDFKLDHCWVNKGVEIDKMDLKIGDKIRFESKILVYLKNGYGINQRADYCLSTPKNIQILK